MTIKNNLDDEWKVINPKVNSEAEFFEIVHDFGKPLELVREAISNAIDAHATWIKIGFSVDLIDGNKRLVVTLLDNGDGMTQEVLARDFWGLGYSQFRDRKDAIGEKGHGTKIYLRSDNVHVRTQCGNNAYESNCSRPLADLTANRLHSPRIRPIEKFLDHSGTEITIIGYNDNERSQFVQEVVKDYILWFTKIGSIENIFGIDRHSTFKTYLKCLDQDEYKEIDFGHPFPKENSDIQKLFDEKGISASDYYAKRYMWKGERLSNHPEVTFDTIISVEGDLVKRSYNPLVGERRRFETGRYRMSDRYGMWICKDYIPITRVNEWITGFGSGSNAFVLLHGFVNCQSLKLTANRGDIANTDPLILEELKVSVKKLIDKVDKELNDKGIYTLREWQEEHRTLQQEKSEFERRIKNIINRRSATLEGHILIEPKNEAELFGLFMSVYTLHCDLFDFEPVDYNAKLGIDIIAKNKGEKRNIDGTHWYVELKYMLQAKRFNHAFQYLRWIICWDFDKSVSMGCNMEGIEDTDVRELQTSEDKQGNHIYFLDSKQRAGKVQIIRLKEFLKERLNTDFK
jgi:hypothetical protein